VKLPTPFNAPLNALLVEDDERIRDFLSMVLKDLGLHVTPRATGRDFLETVESLDPDLILLDLGLPDQDGSTLLERLRSSGPRGDVPVIIVTGDDSDATLRRASEAGADEYLIKPISARELRWRVKSILKLNRYRRCLQEADAREKAENERTGLESVIRGIADSPGTLFVLLDNSGRVIDCNEEFRRRYLPPTGFFLDAVHPFDLASFESEFEALERAGPGSSPLLGNLCWGGDDVTFVRGMATRLAGSHHNSTTLVLLVEDRRNDLSTELLDQVAIAEEFIQIAAGAAHDLRNAMGVVEMEVALMEMDPAPEDNLESIANLKCVSKEARHLTGLLTGQLGEALEAEGSTHLLDAMEELFRYLRTAVPRRISLELEIEDELRGMEEAPVIPMSSIDLRRCLLNLAINARDAIRGPGAITVRIGPSVTPAPGVVVEIEDTGSGIPPEVLPRIFDPLFTTNPSGSGTGLGLSVVSALVARAGGHVAVESRVGEGSCFRIYFPLCDLAAEETEPLVLQE